MIRRRRLGLALRRLRDEAGMKGDDVTAATGIPRVRVYRLEGATAVARPDEVRQLLTLYGVPEDDQRALVALAEQSGQRDWWYRYSDVMPDWFEPYAGLEAEATGILTYQAELVPGMLQTTDYTRALMTAAGALTPDEIDRAVELRQARQARLTSDRPLALHAVINEAVLRRPVGGPDVMRAQMERLAGAAELPAVTLQVLPFSAGAHASMTGSFSLLDFDDFPPHVYLEHITSAWLLEQTRDVGSYRLVFQRLTQAALSPEESTRSELEADP